MTKVNAGEVPTVNELLDAAADDIERRADNLRELRGMHEREITALEDRVGQHRNSITQIDAELESLDRAKSIIRGSIIEEA